MSPIPAQGQKPWPRDADRRPAVFVLAEWDSGGVAITIRTQFGDALIIAAPEFSLERSIPRSFNFSNRALSDVLPSLSSTVRVTVCGLSVAVTDADLTMTSRESGTLTGRLVLDRVPS